MDTRNTNSMCEQAKPYYHDLLCGQNFEIVPDYITFHVQQCWYCRKQIDELKRILSPAAKGADTGLADAAAITDILRLHLAYVGEAVTCEAVKPFLPGMLIPSLEVRVPTPITAHLDKCAPCARDLELLRNLNLSRQQLRRLSGFFTEKPVSCSSADIEKQKAAQLIAAGNWGNLSAETLRHACKCSRCSSLVYDQRQKMLEDLKTRQGGLVGCDAVLAGGFFDFVFPYGLNPSDDQYASFRRTFASHIADCPDCLSKVQLLHGLIYQIITRPDSGIVTVFSKETAAVGEPLEKCDAAYEDFPIKVDVLPQAEEAPQEVPVIKIADVKKRKSPSLAFEIKAGIAAVILIAVGLTTFFYRPVTADPTPLDKMYKAMQKVSHVHTMQFAPGKKTPVSERWVSRTLGIDKTTDNRTTVLSDTHKKIRKIKYLDKDKVEILQLTSEDLAAVKKNIIGFRGQTPLLSDTRMTEWRRLDSGDLSDVPAGVEVYERNWQKDLSSVSPGLVEFNKWRIFVDRGTFLPRRTEYYRRLSDEDEFTLDSFHVYEYPTDEQMQAVISEN